MKAWDEFSAVEEEGIELVERGDMVGARAKFLEAYAAAETPKLKASILLFVAGTFSKEGNRDGVRSTVAEGLKIIAREKLDAPIMEEQFHVI